MEINNIEHDFYILLQSLIRSIEWKEIRPFKNINYRFYHGNKEVMEFDLQDSLFIEYHFWDVWKIKKDILKDLGFGIIKAGSNWILYFDIKKLQEIKKLKQEDNRLKK